MRTPIRAAAPTRNQTGVPTKVPCRWTPERTVDAARRRSASPRLPRVRAARAASRRSRASTSAHGQRAASHHARTPLRRRTTIFCSTVSRPAAVVGDDPTYHARADHTPGTLARRLVSDVWQLDDASRDRRRRRHCRRWTTRGRDPQSDGIDAARGRGAPSHAAQEFSADRERDESHHPHSGAPSPRGAAPDPAAGAVPRGSARRPTDRA